MISSRRRGPRWRSRDRHLAATVKVRLESRDEMDICDLTVMVKAGVVLLQGRVPTAGQKGLATGAAASVRGVRGVFNELRVDEHSS
ncbi:MAG TPA: BON domain-containing protein [Anaerolineae bacterium]|nr:BON domain-containing protein [Anaerolineae bacterium]